MNHEKSPQFNQLHEQRSAGHREMTVLVERSGGNISTGKVDGSRTEDGRYVVNVTMADGRAGERYVSADSISDEYQSELAEKMVDSDTVEGNEYSMTGYYEQHLKGLVVDVDKNTELPDDVKKEAREALLKGSIDGAMIGDPSVARNGGGESEQREFIATMLTRNPESREAAKAIVEKGVVGFHGTNSIALAGIIEAGALLSTKAMRSEGLAVATGEHLYQKQEGQNSISFANLGRSSETLMQYVGKANVVRKSPDEIDQDLGETIHELQGIETDELSQDAKRNVEQVLADNIALRDHVKNNPDSLVSVLSRNRFPVAFGVSREVVEASDRRTLLRGVSSMGEFRPTAEKIALADLPVVAVPREVVHSVKELFEHFGYHDTVVIPLETIE